MELSHVNVGDMSRIVRWPTSSAELWAWAGLNSFPGVSEMLSWHADPDVHAYVLRRGKRPIAYGEVWVDSAEREVELARIIVEPAERGVGVGGKLVGLLVERAADFGQPVAFVRVVPGNIGAIRCYAGQGFRPVPSDAAALFNREQPVSYLWFQRRL